MARNFCEMTSEMENPISQRRNAEVKVAPKVKKLRQKLHQKLR